VDPLAEIDLGALAPALDEPTVPKIMHGADYDLRVLDRDFGLKVRGLFDTMLAARLTGETAFGLAALLEKHFGLILDKKFQRADWSLRPLPEEMKFYAAMDTRHLADLAELLQKELDRLGRSAWAREEFRRLEEVRWREPSLEDAFRRVKGSGSLDRRGLAVLRELVAFREKAARRSGRPPFKVFGNELLLSIARAMPRSERELAAVPKLPASWSRGRRLGQLWRAFASALEVPEQLLPKKNRLRSRRPDKKFEKQLARLSRGRDCLAAELGIESSLLASRTVLSEVLSNIKCGKSPEDVSGLRAWQGELLRPLFEGLDA
jgi:ribonuclease D